MNRLRSAYFIAANTAILWLLLEAGAHLAIVVNRALAPPFGYAQLSEPARANYPHLSPEEIDELWRETEALRFRYAPGVGPVQAQVASRFINVDERGVRSNGTARHPLDGATWFFGGSTTFGHGVADRETIPAHLEAANGQTVINLGVRSHFSAIENRLLNYYLRLGLRPATAIFLDGINEACEADVDQDALGELVMRSEQGYTWDIGRPVVYAARVLFHRALRAAGIESVRRPDDELTCHTAGTPNSLTAIHARVLAERATLCDLYAIECRTFIQPFAGLHGRQDDPAFRDSADAVHLRGLFAHLEPQWRNAGVTFVTDALDTLNRHAYVDDVHYSAEANRHIAAAIGRTLRSAATTAAGAGDPQQ